MLLSVGAPQSEAVSVAQAIIGWRSHEQARSEDAAPSKAHIQGANDGFFADVDQVAEVPGMRPEWVAAIRPLTTVFGAETVNPLTAPAGVIASVPGVDRDQVAAFLAARRSSPNDAVRLAATLGPWQQFVAAKPQQVVSLELAATLADGYTVAAHAVIVLLPHDQQPFRILAWTPLRSSTVM